MTASAEIRGMSQKFGVAPAKMLHLVRQATAKTALDTMADSRRAAPVDTGYLRNSHQVRMEPGGLGQPVVGEVYVSADYAFFVENGTENQGAQPFLRPAMEKNAARWEQALGQLGLEVME